MLESFPLSLAAGTLLGALSGLGVGGGSLLILWLTLVLNMDPATARQINLMFFVPAALAACCFRWKQGQLPLKQLLPGMAAGCCAALLFSWLGAAMDSQWLKKLFGGLLLVTGVRELLWKQK